jgi:hypothetical protein
LLTAAAVKCVRRPGDEVRIVASLDDALALRSGHLRILAIQGPLGLQLYKPPLSRGLARARTTPMPCAQQSPALSLPWMTRAFSCADMDGGHRPAAAAVAH